MRSKKSYKNKTKLIYRSDGIMAYTIERTFNAKASCCAK